MGDHLPLPVHSGTILTVHPPQAQVRSGPDTPRVKMVMGGLLGGGLGALVGYQLGRSGRSGDVGAEVAGASLGSAVGIPLGVHIANGRRGSLLVEEAVSLGIALIALRAAGPDADAVPLLVAAPLVSLGASIVIEERTTRKRSRW